MPVCSPRLLDGEKPLKQAADILQHTLLHEETRNAWQSWLQMAGVETPARISGPVFSHSSLSLKAAVHGQGIALANSVLAKPELDSGHLVRLFNEVLPTRDAFHLVCRESQAEVGKIATFRNWLLDLVDEEEAASEYH